MNLYKHQINCLILILAACLIYVPSLNNGFVNWDDGVYIQQNNDIVRLSFKNIKSMFSRFVNGSYHPLTSLSFAFDYAIDKVNPFTYHLHNLILHCLNAILVYCILIRLVGVVGALCAALLFAIHPMHVESVAWASERKDVLYGFFYLSAMLAYIQYLKTQLNLRWIVGVLLLFVLSLLSKPAAIMLPLVLLSLDFLLKRKIDLKCLLEKIPFLILSIIFGIIALNGGVEVEAINSSQDSSIFSKLLVANHSILIYLGKVIYPWVLSCIYPYPDILSIEFFLFPIITIAVVLAISVSTELRRKILFGMIFFIIGLVPILQLVKVGDAYLADRFTYIPSIGILFIGAVLIEQVRISFSRRINIVLIVLLIVYVGFLGKQSQQRTKVWASSSALWTDAIEKFPKTALAYNNRGLAKSEEGVWEEAIADYNQAILLKSNYIEAFVNRGLAFKALGKRGSALDDFNHALSLRPTFEIYNNRGNLLRDGKDFELAIEDYNKAIAINSKVKEVYNNRGVAYVGLGDYQLALEDFNKAINLNPDYIKAVINKAVVFSKLGKNEQAIVELNVAIDRFVDNVDLRLTRAQLYLSLNQPSNAIKDFKKILNIQPSNMQASQMLQRMKRDQ